MSLTALEAVRATRWRIAISDKEVMTAFADHVSLYSRIVLAQEQLTAL